jgi:hypothetical protein
MRWMTTPKHGAVITNAYINEAALLPERFKSSLVCCAPPRFPEFAQRQARNPGLFARNEPAGAVNGVKGKRETNHNKELREASGKVNGY